MGAVHMLATARRRGRWPAVMALAVLVGIAGGAVIASVAGARRTATSVARFQDSTAAAQFEINLGDASAAQVREFARTPGVEALGTLRQVALYNERLGYLPSAAPTDGRFGTVVDRPRLVAGRSARGVHELEVGERLAARLGLDVGDTLTFASFTPEQVASPEVESGVAFDPRGPRVEFRVVGIVRRPLDLGARGEAGGVIIPTRAFLAEYGETIGSFGGSILRVRVAADADRDAVAAAARRVFGDDESFGLVSLAIEAESARSAVDTTASALWILAAVALAAGSVAVAFALARLLWVDVDEQEPLRAMGLRRVPRAAATAALTVPVALIGAVIAAALAFVASPAFPLGVARDAELDAGFRFDAAAVIVGAGGVALVVLCVGAVVAWSVTRQVEGDAVASSLVRRVAATAAATPTARVGVGFALERGRGRGAVPVWSTIAVMTLGVMGVVGALTFGSSLHRVATDPASYGWTWDYTAFGFELLDDPCPSDSVVADVADVADVAHICYSSAALRGHETQMRAFVPIRGAITPTLVAGRPPQAPNEVALGRALLDDAGVGLGDRVRIRTKAGQLPYRVVGQVVTPILDDPVPLADGVVVTPEGLARAGGAFDSYTVLRVGESGDHGAVLARLRELSNGNGTRTNTLPTEVQRLRQIDALPTVLAAFAAIVGLVAVAFTLTVSVRRRSRELAVLETMGFVRRQVGAVVAWHATTLALMGLAVGVLLGLFAGRLVWQAVARGLGVSESPTVPVVELLVLVPITIGVVNLIALVPARTAARLRPAVVLRSE